MVNGKYSYQINVSTWNISKNENKNILNKFTSVENFKEKKNTFNHIHKTRSLTNINANIKYMILRLNFLSAFLFKSKVLWTQLLWTFWKPKLFSWKENQQVSILQIFFNTMYLWCVLCFDALIVVIKMKYKQMLIMFKLNSIYQI